MLCVTVVALTRVIGASLDTRGEISSKGSYVPCTGVPSSSSLGGVTGAPRTRVKRKHVVTVVRMTFLMLRENRGSRV